MQPRLVRYIRLARSSASTYRILSTDRLVCSQDGITGRRILLKEESFVNAVRIAFERQRAIFQMRQEQGCDRIVIVQKIAASCTRLRVVELIEIGELQAWPSMLGRFLFYPEERFNACSRPTWRPLSFAQSEIDGRAQLLVAGPVGELDLGDQFRLHPDRPSRNLVRARKRLLRRLQRLQSDQSSARLRSSNPVPTLPA